ncbi:M20 family peptidase [Anaerosphaera multitolerans]|uniref:Peptidase M20 domain-containing protein 2 n=2 Tax=Anaerosphaera multitolerans TaxID=2487351 RepID=A0A437S5E0_9FIRM|nr:M20 family peptidase [Anaerosphaera multitolerans]
MIFEVSDYIFNNPELGDEEYKSSAYLTKLLIEEGFKVEKPYMDLETAFRAEFKNGDGPTVAFLAEYDALPGYGPDKKPAHACGHNWIAASTVGAAILLAKDKELFKGTIVVFGTPAEETTGRKIDMAEGGAFDNIDAAFQMHLYKNTNLKARALAMGALEFEFTGKATHASVNPEDGINALDAVMLTFTGINYLRQQLKSDVRIHGIVTKGGDAANTIPDHCKCLFYVRAAKKDYFEKTYEKVKNCAKGASLMTGAQLKINYPENTYYDLVVNTTLAELMEKHMALSGFEPLCQEEEVPGSTDIGNVSYACPTLYGNVGIGDGKALVHEEAFLQYANSEEAKNRLLMVVESFLGVAIELSENPKLVQEVKENFNIQVK